MTNPAAKTATLALTIARSAKVDSKIFGDVAPIRTRITAKIGAQQTG